MELTWLQRFPCLNAHHIFSGTGGFHSYGYYHNLSKMLQLVFECTLIVNQLISTIAHINFWYRSLGHDVRQDTLALSLEMQEAYPYAKLVLRRVQYGMDHAALNFDDGLFLPRVKWGYRKQHDHIRHHENIVIDKDARPPRRQVMSSAMIDIIFVSILMDNGNPPMDRMSVMLPMLIGNR